LLIDYGNIVSTQITFPKGSSLLSPILNRFISKIRVNDMFRTKLRREDRTIPTPIRENMSDATVQTTSSEKL